MSEFSCDRRQASVFDSYLFDIKDVSDIKACFVPVLLLRQACDPPDDPVQLTQPRMNSDFYPYKSAKHH